MPNSKIDIVVTWVDGNDPEWLAEKKKYDNADSDFDDGSNSSKRYRDWGLMKYWFRGVDKYMPWINKIYFVTWGHLPDWLNTAHEKLVIVKHTDFIPQEYLPTYNSSVLELNIHRIKGLSENFISFNDDFFVIAPTKEEMFFKNDLPCDMLLSEIMYNYEITDVFRHAIFNNIGIINKHFGTHKKGIKEFSKWVNPKYGFKNMLTNLNKFFFKRVVGFKDQHITIPFKKSTFDLLWNLEYDNLNRVCMNKFRTPFDVTEWLMRYWNFMTGKFIPTNINKIGEYTAITDSESVNYICEAITNKSTPILVINDTFTSNDDEEFKTYQKRLISAFEAILPDKCSYEK